MNMIFKTSSEETKLNIYDFWEFMDRSEFIKHEKQKRKKQHFFPGKLTQSTKLKLVQNLLRIPS